MPATATIRLLDRVLVLKYATVDRAPTYRAVVQAFHEAKQCYRIQLRPGEVLEALRASSIQHELDTQEELERALDQLVQWGNLAAKHDTAAARTLAEYNRRRYLYRLTPEGEAAHRAVQDVEKTFERSGSLQTEMLRRIQEAVEGLAAQATAAADRAPDGQRVVRLLVDLHNAFDRLTREANLFMSKLTEHLTAGKVDEKRYQLHKQAVLDYISTFVARLGRVADPISVSVGAVNEAGIGRLLRAAAPFAELPPPLHDEDPQEQWIAAETDRWAGLSRWFVGTHGEEPTIQQLGNEAVQAVVRLTRALDRLNERRVGGGDRAVMFVELARAFAGCASDDDAHELWQRAFGLHAARHFHLAEEDVELTSASTSWWDAEPVEVAVRLRTHGRISKAGRPSPAADHSSAREWMAQRRRREQARREAAARRFVDSGPQRLGELGRLDDAELQLLLELLDCGLAAPAGERGEHRAHSRDGALAITLTPPACDAPGPMVAIATPRGVLRARDWTLEVVASAETTRARRPRRVAG